MLVAWGIFPEATLAILETVWGNVIQTIAGNDPKYITVPLM